MKRLLSLTFFARSSIASARSNMNRPARTRAASAAHRILSLSLALALIGGWLSSTVNAHAQAAASLTAEVDRTELSTDDTLNLTLTLKTPDGSAPRLTLPTIRGFRVAGSSMSSQLSSINGAMSSITTYEYRLQPTSAGTFRIPSMILDWNGQSLSTDGIDITVTQGSGAAPQTAPSSAGNGASADSKVSRVGDHDFFMETSIDKETPYQGEAVKHVTRLFSSLTLLGQPDYQAPQFVGFWHANEPDVQQYQSTASDGTPYDVTDITTWLFPTTAGKATIDPVKVTVPGGFFSNDVNLQSGPLTIDVQPLPAGAPADFNGAVGQFQLTATPDKTSTRLGEPITLRVELSGVGNWGTLGDVQWPSDKQWRVFNNKTNSKNQVVNGEMTGSRIYEQLFTPLTEGKLTMPAITYSYFDPITKQYQTLSTDALTIDVTAGDPNVPVSLPKDQAAAPAKDQSAAPALALKPAPQTLMSEAKPLTQQPLFGLLFIIPVGLVAGELAVSARKHYLNSNAARLRKSRALKHAQRQLKRVRRSKNAQIETGQIILVYLEDQIQTPLTGLSHSTLAQLLQQHHISPALIDRIIAALFVGEVSEYGQAKPQTAQRDDVIKSTGQLLEDLEKELTA
jgi:hypothetical protein